MVSHDNFGGDDIPQYKLTNTTRLASNLCRVGLIKYIFVPFFYLGPSVGKLPIFLGYKMECKFSYGQGVQSAVLPLPVWTLTIRKECVREEEVVQ